MPRNIIPRMDLPHLQITISGFWHPRMADNFRGSAGAAAYPPVPPAPAQTTAEMNQLPDGHFWPWNSWPWPDWP